MADATPRRVSFLITGLGIGGAEMQLARLATALHARGWSVHVLALRELSGVGEELHQANLPVQTLTPAGVRLGPRTLVALVRALRAQRPDCLVTFLLQANVIGRLAGAWCGVPVVSSIRNSRFGGDGRYGARIGDLLERITAPLSHAVVINAQSTAARVVARRVVAQRQVRVVGNALAPPAAALAAPERARLRSEFGLPEGAFVWLTAGRLQPQKNQLDLLEAFARHCQRTPEAHLLLAGEGPLEASLRARIEGLGLARTARLLGLRRDLPQVLHLADAFVLASRWEGLPNVVMEALAAGVPTLATPVGGIDELIEDGVSGWVAASADADDIASAMDRVTACSARERSIVAARGRARVVERYGLEAIVDGWTSVIEEALAPRGARRRA